MQAQCVEMVSLVKGFQHESAMLGAIDRLIPARSKVYIRPITSTIRSWMRGITDRHALFDINYYIRHNSDVVAAKLEPYRHFLQHGWKEGRNPNPLFDTNYYLTSLPELEDAGIDPLTHFVSVGWKEFRNPHPMFDVQFYLRTNPDVALIGVNPLVHYLEIGWREGRDPNPAFSTSRYLQDNPDVAHADYNPLAHYVEFGVSGKRTVRLANPNTAIAAGGVNDNLRVEPPEELIALEDCVDLAPFFLQSPKSPRVSVVIPVHGHITLTLRCLFSLSCHATAYDFEVIVVIDGSDREMEQALTRARGVRLLTLNVSQGFVAACNEGAAHARGEFVLFLNNDTFVLPGWLDELVKTFEVFPQVGAVGSALIYPNGRLQEAGAVVWNDAVGHNVGRNQHPDDPSYGFARKVDYCSGASLIVPLDLFRQLGGFDSEFSPGYYEDTDLCFSIREAGYDVYCQPLSRVVHVEGGTSGTDLKHGMKRFQEINRKKFMKKWENLFRDAPSPATFRSSRFVRPGQRRMVIADWALPDPNVDAGSFVLIEIMKVFQKLGYLITFCATTMLRERDSRVRDLERLGIEVIRAPFYGSINEFLDVRGNDFDLLFMVRCETAKQLVSYIRPPSMLLLADLHYLREERQAALYPDQNSKSTNAMQRESEFSAIRTVDLTITHSTYEQALLLKELPDKFVTLLPWIVQTTTPTRGFEQRRDILFVGGFDHAPNIDAIVYFVVHLWPAIRAELPEAELRIVGSRAGAAIYPLEGNGVKIVGFVEDLQAELERARVAIAPLRWGAGFKGKVATAIAAGLPNVVSPIAAEGMGLIDEDTCLIAEPGPDFVSAVRRLYTDAGLWNDISSRGLKLAETQWSRDRATEIVIDALQKTHATPTYAVSDHFEAQARARPTEFAR